MLKLQRTWRVVIESLLLSALVFLLCKWLKPDDPLLIEGPFPWLWLPAAYIALRYGFLASLFPMLLIMGFYLYEQAYLGWSLSTRIYFLSGVLWTVFFSVFHDHWQNAIEHWRALGQFNAHQIKELGKTYYTVRLSHDQLEESLISKPFTLRSAFEALQEGLMRHQGELTQKHALYFLQLLSNYCSLRQCAFYLYDQSSKMWEEAPFVHIGMDSKLNMNDPLIQYVINSEPQETHTLRALKSDDKTSDYIACCPIVSSRNHIYGMVVIKDMDFWAIHDENFRVLNVLCAHFADQQWDKAIAQSILTHFPDCPRDFAHAFYEFVQFKRRFQVDSGLVFFKMQLAGQHKLVLERLSRQLRATDFIWFRQDETYDYCLVLLTLTSSQGLESFVRRITNWFRSYFLHLYEQGKIQILTYELTTEAPEKQIKSIMNGQ